MTDAAPGAGAGPDVPPAAEPGPSTDAVRRDPDASYARAAAAPRVDDAEVAVVSAQLGRPARGNPAVVHRCVFGLPTVVRVDPRLDDGTPFPTTFWLTCPAMRSQVGRLEADHAMVGLNQQLGTDEALARDYAGGHERYVAFRDELGAPLDGDPGAGGMPGHIKCLHVHAAHHLATGDNPIGAWTIGAATPLPCAGPCVDVPGAAPTEDDASS
ncbi:MAG: DUF501 domain-containing protein [Nitriliruptoraceae bacterium]|nr:DUF501 domain-containing protein [Nitriliruptoraceae bacterium]